MSTVLGGVATRQRRCPTCATTTELRGARWCGSCGAPLTPVRPGGAERRPSRTSGLPRALPVGGVALGVLLVVATAVAVGTLVDRSTTPSAAVRDGIVTPPTALLDRVERLPRRPTPTVTEPECTRAEARSCFAWVVEADGAGFDEVTLAGGLLVSEQALDGTLVGRSLEDGSVVWSVDLAPGFSGGVLRADGDLLVHVDGGDLTGRDPTTGQELWRTDGLGHFAPLQVHHAGGVVVVAGDARHATSYDAGRPRGVVAGLDPTTGAVRWTREGHAVSMAAGGVTVATGRDGYVRAFAPSGALRWRSPEPFELDPAVRAWAAGHVVVIDSGSRGDRLHRLLDGTPLGLEGVPVADDDEHTLVQLHDETAAIALLDERGEVWRIDGTDWTSCLSAASLEVATVEITPCGGGRVTLRRATGAELGRAPPPATEADAFGGDRFGRIGPYLLSNSDPTAQAAEVSVVDLRTGYQVAHLPPESRPVWRDRTWQDGDLGAVAVLHSRRWLVALPLPTSPRDDPFPG